MSREVHLADGFLLDTVRQFRTERGPRGEPTVQDFFDQDLENVRFVFAVMWDMLDRWPGHPRYRFRHIQGSVAFMYYVVGVERPDGSIELLQLDVDHDWPEDLE